MRGIGIMTMLCCLAASLFGQMSWSLATGSAAWSARELHTTVVFQDAMWVIYGRGEDAKNVWVSTDGADWTLKSTGSGYRNDHTSVVFDGKMWVLGGYDTGNYKNDVWHSADGVSWTEVTTNPPMWEPRIGHASVVFDDKMWVLGGYSYPDMLNDVWYSSDGVTWTAAGIAGWSPRFWHIALVHDNMIWVMGGWDGADRNDVWCSSDGVNWTQKTAAANWCGRHLPSAVVFEDKMCLLGGYSEPGHMNDVWYSTDGANWTEVPTGVPMWQERQAHTSVVFDDKVWVLGGELGFNNFLNDIWYSSGLTGVDEEGWSRSAAGPVAPWISPNPVTSGFAALHLGRSGPVNAIVFDVSGRVLLRQSDARAHPSPMILDVTDLPNGVYSVMLETDEYAARQRLVIQR